MKQLQKNEGKSEEKVEEQKTADKGKEQKPEDKGKEQVKKLAEKQGEAVGAVAGGEGQTGKL